MNKKILKTQVVLALLSLPALGLMGCSTVENDELNNDDLVNLRPTTSEIVNPIVLSQTQSQTETKVVRVENEQPAVTQDSAPKTTTPSADMPKVGLYRDGVYSAVGSYVSPAGDEQIGIKFTVTGDIVTAADVTPMASHPVSSKFQNMFAEGYKQYVVGKSLAGLNLKKVSGSSLTPIGFDQAIKKVQAQAKI